MFTAIVMESTLSLSLKKLQQAVGFYLGYGRGPDASEPAWSAPQLFSINECIDAGLRRFYFPIVATGDQAVYDWSFLKPVSSVTLESGNTTVRLPDDCAGVEGQIIINQGDGYLGVAINVGSIGAVLTRQNMSPTATGRPQLAAIEPLDGTTNRQGQRFQLRVWPTADRDYVLAFQYYVQPDALTSANPWPLGGMQHAETIKESCLAVAEQSLDDQRNVHTLNFQELLAGSIGSDRRNKPQNLGYNGDTSDRVRMDRGWVPKTTVNGVLYD